MPRIILSLLTHFADVMLTGIVLNIRAVARLVRPGLHIPLDYIFMSVSFTQVLGDWKWLKEPAH